MRSKLESHLFACILTERDKKIVTNVTRIMVEPKNILMNLKAKRKYNLTNIKASVQRTNMLTSLEDHIC